MKINKSSIKVDFIDKKEPTKEQNKFNQEIVYAIKKYPLITGARLANHFTTQPQDVRKAIQIIRENPGKYLLKGEYLIAERTGYMITKDKKKISAFAKKTHLMAKSKLIQVDAMWSITKKGW